MAFDLGSVIAHIKADVSDFKAGIAEAKNEANNFKSHLGGLNDGLKQLGVLGLAAGVAFTAFGIKAGFSAARIEELGFALNAVAKANGIAQKSVDSTVKALRENNIAHEKALQITTLFIQSQLDLTDAMKLANVAKDLAVISGQDSSEATITLTEAIVAQRPILLKQFGLNKDLDQMFDEYAATLGKGSGAITINTKKTAANVAQLGKLKQELVVAQQRMGEFTDKTKQSVKTAAQFKVNNLTAQINALSGATTVWGGAAKKTADDLTEAEKTQAVLNAVLEHGKTAVGAYDAAVRSVSKRFRSLTGRIIPDFIAQVGLVFQPAIGIVVDAITAKIQEMSKWLTANKDVVDEWGRKIGEAALTAVNLFGFFVTFLSEHKEIVLAAFIAMGVGLAVLVGAFVVAHAAMIGIVAGITLVIVALKAAWDSNFLGMRDKLTFVWNAIKFIFNTARDFINGWGKDIFKFLVEPFESAWNKIKDILGKINKSLGTVGGKSFGFGIPGFANGVRNFSGGLAMVGERGPELLNLPGGSDVIPNGRFGNMVVNVNMSGATIGDMASATRIAEKMGDTIIRKLQKNIRF